MNDVKVYQYLLERYVEMTQDEEIRAWAVKRLKNLEFMIKDHV